VKSLPPPFGHPTAPSGAHDPGILLELDVIKTNNVYTYAMFCVYYVEFHTCITCVTGQFFDYGIFFNKDAYMYDLTDNG